MEVGFHKCRQKVSGVEEEDWERGRRGRKAEEMWNEFDIMCVYKHATVNFTFMDVYKASIKSKYFIWVKEDQLSRWRSLGEAWREEKSGGKPGTEME